MAVLVEIQNNTDKILTIPEIAGLMNLRYGVSGNGYILSINETGKYTVLFDEKRLGRGFEIWFEENSIMLSLPLINTKNDIEKFYGLIEKLCKELDVYFLKIDDEIKSITDLPAEKESNISTCIWALNDMRRRIDSGEYPHLILLCAFNPICIGINELTEIGTDLGKLEDLLDRLQRMKIYYSDQRFFKRPDDTIYGVSYVGLTYPTVLPNNPKNPFFNNGEPDSYFICLEDGNYVPFKDVMDNVITAEYYDDGHIIVDFNEDFTDMLVTNYSVNADGEKVEGLYWGKTIDRASWHCNKVKNNNLDTDEINGVNHICVFLRWAKENNFLSDKFLTNCPEFNNPNPDYRELFCNHPVIDKKLRIQFFKEDIRDFVREFYVFGGNTDESRYPHCVDIHAEKYFGTEEYNNPEYKDEAYLFVPYDENYYKGLSAYIDIAFEKYCK